MSYEQAKVNTIDGSLHFDYIRKWINRRTTTSYQGNIANAIAISNVKDNMEIGESS